MSNKRANPKDSQSIVNRCEKCHHSPLFRIIHLMRRQDQGKEDNFEHLKEQFPEMAHGEGKEKEWPWIVGQLGFIKHIREHHSKTVDALGVPIPAWRTWLMYHDAIKKVDGGWVIGR